MIRFNSNHSAPPTSQSHFAHVPRADIERSSFDRSHTRKQTQNADYVVPIYYDEVLPGDTFNLKLTTLGRLQPTVKPIMDDLYADVFFIYVPNRLLSSKWESIMGQQPDPDTDVSSYALTPLRFTNKAITAGSLHDYLGMPIQANTFDKDVNPLYHLAYNFIWNELFRDENLQEPVYFDDSEATAYDPDNFTLLKRRKRHDYFTSMLPFPQKGPDVLLPLGDSAPVTGLGASAVMNTPGPTSIWETDATASQVVSGYITSSNALGYEVDPDNPGFPNIRVDLSAATAATVNQVREAFQVQRLLERDARSGTRYIESLLAHFGVVSPDFRLQRPEFLGGGSTRINISPVPQTNNLVSAPLGTLGATGDFSHHNVGFVKSFVEHGVILGLMNIRPQLTYQQGLHRSYNRFSRLDFAFPVLAHLGEQAVLNQEWFMQGDGVTDADGIIDYQVAGYQEQYAEYRYKPSELCGLMRSDAAGSLDVWHLAEDFATLSVLNEEFIVYDTPMERVLAVTDEPQFQIDMSFKLICARPLPLYGVPGLIDHF